MYKESDDTPVDGTGRLLLVKQNTSLALKFVRANYCCHLIAVLSLYYILYILCVQVTSLFTINEVSQETNINPTTYSMEIANDVWMIEM